MPIYVFKCFRCGRVFEEFFRKIEDDPAGPVCGHCNFITKQVVAQPGRDIFPPEGVTLEHVAATPRHFKSYPEMHRYAKEHNMELGALL